MSLNLLWSESTLTRRLAEDYLRKYGPLLKWKNYKETILDVGCAEGTNTKHVLYPTVEKHIEKLVAIDRLDVLIDSAKKTNQDDKIEFQALDIMDKERQDIMVEKYDHIFSFLVLHWIPDTRSFIEILHKMLKPDGQIFMTVMLKYPLHDSIHMMHRETKWSKYLPNNCDLADLTDNPVQYIRNTVEEVGFKIDVCESQQGIERTKKYSDVLTALSRMSKTFDGIPMQLREEYIRDHIKNCRERSTYVEEPDTYDVPFESLICIASKNM